LCIIGKFFYFLMVFNSEDLTSVARNRKQPFLQALQIKASSIVTVREIIFAQQHFALSGQQRYTVLFLGPQHKSGRPANTLFPFPAATGTSHGVQSSRFIL
jgi:hypothetical protein